MNTINATQAKQNFGHCLDNIAKEPLFIERSGRAVAVMLSVEEYNQLIALENEMLAARATEAAKAGYLSAEEGAVWLEKAAQRLSESNSGSQ